MKINFGHLKWLYDQDNKLQVVNLFVKTNCLLTMRESEWKLSKGITSHLPSQSDNFL